MPGLNSQFVPVGNDYLELRARLGTALFALGAMAVDVQAAPKAIETLDRLRAGLHEPLLIVVIGEVKAGKSSLLNALFGRELCRTGVEPVTDCMEVFQYGEPARDTPMSADIIVRYQPIRLLRDFHIVDTPGTNTIVANHQLVTEGFAPHADIVVFVFNIVNPWGETAWKFLEHLHTQRLKNVLFVLQQADLRDDREIRAITEYLRRTSMQRLGQSFPIFPVSAKKAFLAKTSGVDKKRLWEESRFEPLEKQISQMVAGNAARCEKLRSAANTARLLLDDVSGSSRRMAAMIASDRAGLAQLREVIEQLKRRTLEQLDTHRHRVVAVCDIIEHAGESQLNEHLQPSQVLKLVFNRRKIWLETFEKSLETQQRENVSQEIQRIIQECDRNLRLVWRQVLEQFRTRFSTGERHAGSGATAPKVAQARLPEGFFRQRAQLLGELQLVMIGQSADAQIHQQLEELLALDSPASAGVSATNDLAVRVFAHLTRRSIFDFSGVTAALGASSVFGSRAQSITVFREELAKKREQLSQAIVDLFLPGIEAFYTKLAGIQGSMEAFCRAQEENDRPFLERIQALDTNFADIARRL